MSQPFPFDDPKLPKKTRADAEFLLAHGWKFEVRHRQKYGWIYYWEHDDEHMRPRNGYWLTQGEAVMKQKSLEKWTREVSKRVNRLNKRRRS